MFEILLNYLVRDTDVRVGFILLEIYWFQGE
jgi:hypothetical protein